MDKSMTEMDTRMLAVKLLCDLRGQAMEELVSGEVFFIMEFLDKAYGMGWIAGVKHGVGTTLQAESCETCSDGGHEHG